MSDDELMREDREDSDGEISLTLAEDRVFDVDIAAREHHIYHPYKTHAVYDNDEVERWKKHTRASNKYTLAEGNTSWNLYRRVTKYGVDGFFHFSDDMFMHTSMLRSNNARIIAVGKFNSMRNPVISHVSHEYSIGNEPYDGRQRAIYARKAKDHLELGNHDLQRKWKDAAEGNN